MDKGNELLKKGNLETAIKYFDKAITIDPEEAESWNNKAIALMKLGQYAEALKCFDKALYLNSNFAEAWLNKGYLLGMMKKAEKNSFHDIFISHRVEDAEIANKICFNLEKNGIKCWIAPRDILHGKIWLNEIPQAIQSCQVVIIILSNSSDCSPNVLREIILASEQNKKIVPIRIENISPSGGLKFLIQIWQYFDAYDSDIASYTDDLILKLKAILP
jgi:tetratricopeptide (TPR) repeat protein